MAHEVDGTEAFARVEFEAPGHPLEDRLIELNHIEDGWLDGEGETISHHALSITRDVSRIILERNELGIPSVFPMPDGGVQLQWLEKNDSTIYHIETSKYGRICVSGFTMEPEEDYFAEVGSVSEAADCLIQFKKNFKK